MPTDNRSNSVKFEQQSNKKRSIHREHKLIITCMVSCIIALYIDFHQYHLMIYGVFKSISAACFVALAIHRFYHPNSVNQSVSHHRTEIKEKPTKTSTTSPSNIHQITIVVGLFFSLIGDVFLVCSEVHDLFFLVGGIFFSFAHLSYMMAYVIKLVYNFTMGNGLQKYHQRRLSINSSLKNKSTKQNQGENDKEKNEKKERMTRRLISKWNSRGHVRRMITIAVTPWNWNWLLVMTLFISFCTYFVIIRGILYYMNHRNSMEADEQLSTQQRKSKYMMIESAATMVLQRVMSQFVWIYGVMISIMVALSPAGESVYHHLLVIIKKEDSRKQESDQRDQQSEVEWAKSSSNKEPQVADAQATDSSEDEDDQGEKNRTSLTMKINYSFIYRVIGSVLFYSSDMFVARQKFIVDSFLNRAFGLPLYFIAQLLIASSI